MNALGDIKDVLAIEGVSVSFGRGRNRVEIIDTVSLRVAPGEVLALVGESGSGKSVTAMAISRLLDAKANIDTGAIRVDGVDLTRLSLKALNKVRGTKIGFVFQEPMTSLNPLMKIGDQIIEPLAEHLRLHRAAARQRAIDLLRSVGFPAPETRLDDYPHQLSGGQRQRVMIAIAIACNPPLLIADEPTTALDVTTQAQVLELLDQLRRDTGMGMLLITHDLGVVDGIADRVAVMYAGRVVESGATKDVFAHPRHPYTRLLLQALPRVSVKVPRLPVIAGSPPPPHAFPSGCRFHPRCPDAVAQCRQSAPPTVQTGGRSVACFRAAALTEDLA